MATAFFILSLLLAVVSADSDPFPGYDIEEPLLYDKFPDDFIWGVATAAYQVGKESVVSVNDIQQSLM